MSNKTRYRCSPATRLWRRLRTGRNPLLRRSDRVEAVGTGVVVGLFGSLITTGALVAAATMPVPGRSAGSDGPR